MSTPDRSAPGKARTQYRGISSVLAAGTTGKRERKWSYRKKATESYRRHAQATEWLKQGRGRPGLQGTKRADQDLWMRIRNRSEFPAAGSLLRENSRDFETGEHQTADNGRAVSFSRQISPFTVSPPQRRKNASSDCCCGAAGARVRSAPASAAHRLKTAAGDHGIPRRDCPRRL